MVLNSEFDMLLGLVLVAIGCSLTFAYIRWLRVKRYWADRNVPYVPPHPVFGNLTFLLKQNPTLWFREYYKKFKGPYVGIWLFWRPALMVNSFDLARKILVADSNSFRDRFLGSVTKDPYRFNIFLAKDPIWTSVRKRLTGAFTAAKMKAFQNLVSTKSHELVQRINNDIDKNNEIELKSLFVDFTTDVISIISFGIESDATLTGKGHMRDITTELSSFSMYKAVSWCSVFYFPEIADWFKLSFFSTKAMTYMVKIFKEVVAERGGYERKGDRTQIRDLLDALVIMKQEAAKDGEDMDEDILVAQAAVFLLAGFDTTAMILTYCVYELAFAPSDVQNILYNEVLQVKESTGNKETELSGLVYLNSVIQETLRKYPGMGWIDRVATKPYKIDDNLTIPVGTPVYINSYGMHNDPKYYPEPEKFLSDRFLQPQSNQNQPFFSFGVGPRHCIGQRIAMQSLRYAMASMVLNYEFCPLPNTPNTSECKFETKYLLIQPGDKMLVNFVRRNPDNIVKL